MKKWLPMWFVLDLQLEKNWSEIEAMVGAAVKTPWSIILRHVPLTSYCLSVFHPCKEHKKAIECLLSSLLWRMQASCWHRNLCPKSWGAGNAKLVTHRHASRLMPHWQGTWFWQGLWGPPWLSLLSPLSSQGLNTFVSAKINWVSYSSVNLMTFFNLVEFFCVLVEAVTREPLHSRHVLSADELHSSWVPVADYLSNSEFLLTWENHHLFGGTIQPWKP